MATQSPRLASARDWTRYIQLKLAALGELSEAAALDSEVLQLAGPLLQNHFEKDQLLGWPFSPVDARIQGFLDDYLRAECPRGAPALPHRYSVPSA